MFNLANFSLKLGNKEYPPLMVGGMGTNISTSRLVLAIEKLGGIAHLSDAMLPAVVDREFGTQFTKGKTFRFKQTIDQADKSEVKFDLNELREASKLYYKSVMERATGKGLVLVNCMEKLTMNDPIGTLKTRLNAALDAGIDGITMSAGLHLSSLKLLQENPRFNDALIGLVVSSSRALKLFLKRTSSIGRKLDYIIVEGPLAGGHLGFGEDWRSFSLSDIVKDVINVVKDEKLKTPVLGAGGIFNGNEAINFIKETGAQGVQVATRFTISQESGLPDAVKKQYIEAKEEEVVVNHASPTGYLMRMLKQSPGIQDNIRPNCESYGYMLSHGDCPYLKEFNESEKEKTKCCLCTHMRNYKIWTCGTTVSRLKEVTKKDGSGVWILPSAEEIFNDYCYGTSKK